MSNADITIITMVEIDGSVLKVPAYEASEGFLRLDPGAMEACKRACLKLYKDQEGNYYLVDSDKNILAKNLDTIRMYIKYMVK